MIEDFIYLIYDRYPVVRAADSEIQLLQRYLFFSLFFLFSPFFCFFLISLFECVTDRLCSENRKYGMNGNRVNVGQFRFYMGHKSITSNECLAWTDTYGNRFDLIVLFLD